MAAEFKIGRLRYTWKGQWNDGVFYNRDAVSQYEGKTYVCKEPHTSSSNFYDDLYYVTGGGASTPRWELMIDGRAWKEEWTPSTFYSIGNIIRFGGVVYICTEAHTSGLTTIDLTKWDTYAQFDNWNTAWAISTVYGFGDIVKYGGIVYRCVEDHTSADNITDGREADNYKWEVVNNGIEYKGAWTATTRYKLNDLVKLGADVYICTEGHTSTSTFDTTTFNVWLPGTQFENGWTGSALYQKGDIVIYGGYTYVSLINNNFNIIPSVNAVDSSSAWELVTQGYRMMNEWSSGSQYRVGDVVRRGGQLFTAVVDSAGQDPTSYAVTGSYVDTGSSGTTLKVVSSAGITKGMVLVNPSFTQGQTVVSVNDSTTLIISEVPNGSLTNGDNIDFVGVNYLNWRLVVPSIKWTNFWSNTTNYIIGDLVIWENCTYRCIRNHTSSSFFRPDLDVANAFWVVYVVHAKENAGNTQGDIVTFDGTSTVAVPIIPLNGTAGDTEDYHFHISNGQPNWKKMFVIPDLYYVSNDGVDDADHGQTWDKPWRTIAYACQQVENGFYFQNANTLLTQNKNFLVEEMYQWMLYQKANSNSPFSPTSEFQEYSTRRDAELIIDALSYDITRASNSRTVIATKAFFAEGSTTTFFNTETDAAQPYIVAALERLLVLIGYVYQNSIPDVNYQVENIVWDATETYVTDDIVYWNEVFYKSLIDDNIDNNPETVGNQNWEVIADPTVQQYINNGLTLESGAYLEITSLMNIVINAVENASTENVPLINQGQTTSIMIKTGTYSEELPIVVADNTALIGDELRGTVVQPKVTVYTSTSSSSSSTNRFTLRSIKNVVVDMPIQFSAATLNDDFSGVTLGQTYYVKEIVGSQISISETVGGDVVALTTGTGFMTVYAGDCLKDMFYVRNATGIRNMTLTGLAGSLTSPNGFGTRRPTGGAYVSLDPGNGPDDTRTWIIRRSPYIQNVTTFGVGCVGYKVDGTLHNGGNKSITTNDFTQILSDGIGCWCTGTGSLTEAVSVFSYYAYAGYFAEDGGRIRATNGNSSYGTYGVIAEGYDDTEVPISGKIDNRSSQVQASVQSAFGTNAELLSIQFSNAGSNYVAGTTNLLQYSNKFSTSPWTTDGNVTIQKNTTSPFGQSDAWTLTGSTSGSDSSYIYQNISVLPPGKVYTAVDTVNVTGSGSSATFDITVGATGYSAVVNAGGSGYVTGNELRIPGSSLGGEDGTNDCFLTVATLSGSSILSATVTGVVPTNSDLNYTFSIYAKQGSSATFDIAAIYSGSSTVYSYLEFTFSTKGLAVSTASGGAVPVSYGKLELTEGWYRIWMTVYDNVGLNNNLQFRIYPRGRAGLTGNTRFYGAQVQINSDPTFYLETENDQYTAYANYSVVGAGTNARLIGDEIRSNAIFQARITDTGSAVGGRNYLVSSNNAQAGDEETITLAGSDTKTASNYIGMRVFLNSGTGAGQYGYISSYDEGIKVAQILKESFEPLNIISTDNSTGILTLDTGYTTDTLYLDQPVQFIPTYYSTTVSNTSVDFVNVVETIGGSTNTVILSSTAKLTVNMQVRFGGAVFGGVTDSYTYYIKEILDSTTITISTEPFGTAWLLNSATGAMTMSFPGYNSYVLAQTNDMKINMPIQFTGTSMGDIAVGTTYYVNDVISLDRFTISTTLVTITPTATTAATNYITTSSTASLVPLNPIEFTGVVFGGIVAGTKYYINKIVNSSTFTITDTVISVTVTETETLTNLITVDSTAGFVANNPIKFTGNTFGGIVNETTYYILAVNDATTFTISASPGGSALNLSTATGNVLGKTTAAAFTLSTASGSMTGTTTNSKSTLTIGYGSMNGTYSTNLFGDVSAGITYYVKTIDSTSTFTVSGTPGGTATTLKTDTGSMNIAAVGWDHMNPGTTIESLLDNSTVYYVEPRVTISAPGFTQTATTTNTLAPGSSWVGLDHGNGTFIALPSGNAIAGKSTDGGATWDAIPLPSPKTWTDIAYGNNRWAVISSGAALGETSSTALYSINDGEGWRITTLPSVSTWSKVAYGNGKFVAIATESTSSAYSSDYGGTWNSGTGLVARSWTGLTFGNGKFVAVSDGTTYTGVTSSTTSGGGSGATFNVTARSSGYTVTINNAGSSYTTSSIVRILGTAVGGASTANDITITVTGVAAIGGAITEFSVAGTASSTVSTTASYSTSGASWTSATLPSSTTWSDVAYGNGLFIAVSSSSAKPAYSRDGITWTQSPYTISGVNKIEYGQGVFLALSSTAGVAYTSEDGYSWTERTVSDDGYGAIKFAFVGANNDEGKFVTVAEQTVGSIIETGCRTKGRAVITSGTITSISLWEPGSGYTGTPTLTFRDPNVTVSATTSLRTSNGTLGNPTFVNRGQDYNTNSTIITINGSGYADTFQTGLTLIVKNLSKLPAPGDNLVITGNSKIYKVTSATPVYGTVAPNIEANIEISPDMSVELSPAHEANIIIRTKYSQARLTGHDFLNVGYGNAIESNYPNLPTDTVLAPQDQAVEVNFGRVFYTSTDQDGNFKVGDLFGVEQATGIVTLSATQFGLTGLETLSLGGIAVGGSSVVIRQFSTDETFIANSNNIIPTQRAIKAYLTGRLSQGGANTFTGQLIAGTVLVGGADRIASTIPEGLIGAVVNMPTKVTVDGQFGGWDGDGMAYSYFVNTWNRPGAI